MKVNKNILEKLNGVNILITGATGLIGSNIVKYLLKYNKYLDNSMKITVVIRDKKKADSMFKDYLEQLTFIETDIRNVVIEQNYNYVIHTASNTSSQQFINEPVETIDIAYEGTKNLLSQLKYKTIDRFIYLSTMEVYGTPQNDKLITETSENNIDTSKVRACYPESKRLCENLCFSYAYEFGIPINVIRLTQTIGPGINYYDSRVFAEFARCVVEKKDIVLKTQGKTKRSYLYSEDAVNAILCVMLSDCVNEIFNAANEETYCSILEMAKTVANKVSCGDIKVIIKEEKEVKNGFAPNLCMNLSSKKLRNIGWTPTKNLIEMYKILIDYMKEIKTVIDEGKNEKCD